MTECDRPQFTASELHDMVVGIENPTISESNPKPKENTGTKIKRLFVAGATAATITIGAGSLAGCAETPPAITDVQPSETNPSVTTSKNGTSVEVDPVGTTETMTTPKPTEAPTATPTPTEAPLTPEQQEEKDLQEKMKLAPDIEGAEKVIKEINGLKRVTYERDGVYIGEYKKEVTQTDENGKVTEVGGIVLIGSEAEKILDEKLTETGSDYLIALPADISDLTTLEKVNIDLSSEPLLSGPFAIRIDCGDNKISVCNVMPGEIEIRQRTYEANGYTGNMSITNHDSDHIIEGKEMKFIYNWTKFTNSDSQFSSDFKTLAFGDTFGETINPILIAYTAIGSGELTTQSLNETLTVDKVMDDGTVVEVPVFVVSK